MDVDTIFIKFVGGVKRLSMGVVSGTKRRPAEKPKNYPSTIDPSTGQPGRRNPGRKVSPMSTLICWWGRMPQGPDAVTLAEKFPGCPH